MFFNVDSFSILSDPTPFGILLLPMILFVLALGITFYSYRMELYGIKLKWKNIAWLFVILGFWAGFEAYQVVSDVGFQSLQFGRKVNYSLWGCVALPFIAAIGIPLMKFLPMRRKW